MREVKDKIRKEIDGKTTVDPSLSERYGDNVLFQHKIDRLKTLLKGTILDPTIVKAKA